MVKKSLSIHTCVASLLCDIVSEGLGETAKTVKNETCAVPDRKQELTFLELVIDAFIVSLKIPTFFKLLLEGKDCVSSV